MSNEIEYPYRDLVDKLESEIRTLYDENTSNPLLRRRLSKILGYVRDLRSLRMIAATSDVESVGEACDNATQPSVPPMTPPTAAPCAKETRTHFIYDATTRPTAPQPGDVWQLDILGLKTNFHYCPPGTFLMGSPIEEEGSKNNETLHEVTLTRGFWLGESPVTVEAFKRFADASGYKTLPERTRGSTSNWKRLGWDDLTFEESLSHPVVYVSWDDAQEYIKWLNGNCAPSGMKFQLPTEAQWEYACRAGTTTRFSWGDEWDASKLNVVGDGTKPVGWANYANAWGFVDMHGGVWEMCEDWLSEYPKESVTDPFGMEKRLGRVARGGCWACRNKPELCRSATRNWTDLSSALNIRGFRVEIADVIQ